MTTLTNLPVSDAAILPSQEVVMLRNNRNDAYYYKYRRSLDFTENYELYRDKVQVNRLTQRQSVNLPLMKAQIRTLLTDIDDLPVIYFENLDNDKQAELFKNEYWKWTSENNRMDLQDIVDKKQVLLFGRSFDQWQIVDGAVKMTVQDPQDIQVSRYTDPFNLHSSRYLIHLNIFVPLSSLKKNPDYDKAEIAQMEQWFATRNGIVKSTENERDLIEKNQKMRDMGVLNVDDPVLGETYVELAMHFVYRDQKITRGAGPDGTDLVEDIPTQIYLYVLAENTRVLMKKPLEEVIGVTKDHYWRNHFPYCSWADDLERQDFWSDAVADAIRTPNKILNSWFSQLVENRTLRNFGMHYFNSLLEGFTPPTIQPAPGAWIGLPIPPNTNINEVFQKVDIPDLSESLDEMQFLIGIMEKASGATATQQGAQTDRQITLGEVQLALTQSQSRIKGMSKFYTPVWKERGMMFVKLLEAAPEKIDAVRIYKKGRNTSAMYSREVAPKDWMTPLGYITKVWSQDDKDTDDINTLQKQNAVKGAMPNNPKVTEIYDRKLLEWANYTPDQINDIMQMEEQQRAQAMQSGQMGGGMPGQPQPGQQPGMPPQLPGMGGMKPPSPQLPGAGALPAPAAPQGAYGSH